VKKIGVPILIGGITAVLVIVITAISLFLLPDRLQKTSNPTAIITLIEAPTATNIPRETLMPTNTPIPANTPSDPNGLSVQKYAQIYGTEGDGLRLRSAPGQSASVNFIGMDNEVFLIIDGPQEADGYIWWHLESPYDTGRNGWAAENYLQIVTTPTP